MLGILYNPCPCTQPEPIPEEGLFDEFFDEEFE
jgi:hypothetical protein